jgi:hypothetical protein
MPVCFLERGGAKCRVGANVRFRRCSGTVQPQGSAGANVGRSRSLQDSWPSTCLHTTFATSSRRKTTMLYAHGEMMRTITLSLIVAAACYGQNSVTAGRFHSDPPTLENLGFLWSITGDANRNGRVEVDVQEDSGNGLAEGLTALAGGWRANRARSRETEIHCSRRLRRVHSKSDTRHRL